MNRLPLHTMRRFHERFAERGVGVDVAGDLEESLTQLQALGLQQQLAETYVHLSCCFHGLGWITEAETAVASAMKMAVQIDSGALDNVILRCRALLAPANEAVALLEQALAQARHSRRRLDEAQCLLRLSGLSSGQQRDELWAEGSEIMHAIGAAAWLDGRSPQNPPSLAMIL